MEFVEVDGSLGEGGGQILRTAVAFSAILSAPVKVSKIRAGRPEPGLKNQHLSALRVLSDVFGGELSGGRVGSTEVTFVPGPPRDGSYSLDMGTAASITLVLQAVVPAVALAGARLSLDLVGGTDVPWSPTFDYFAEVVKGALGAVGMRFDISSDRRGYYPRGGGRSHVAIEPCKRLTAVSLTTPARVDRADIFSRCGSLPRNVADRQLESASKMLAEKGVAVGETLAVDGKSDSPGSSVLVCSVGRAHFLGGDSLGARGRPAEEVGSDAATRFVDSARSGANLDANVADMIVPLLSLADDVSTVSVQSVSQHLKSGMRLAGQFTSAAFDVSGGEGCSVITVRPKGSS